MARMNVNPKEVTMFVDFPLEPPQAAVIYVAAAAVSKDSTSMADAPVQGSMGVCSEGVVSGNVRIYPIFDAEYYYEHFTDGSTALSPGHRTRSDIEITIVEAPRHGELIRSDPEAIDSEKYLYSYYPEPDYEGEDQFVLDLTVEGKTLRIYYQVALSTVFPHVQVLCEPDKGRWKISQSGGSVDSNGLEAMGAALSGLGNFSVRMSQLADFAIGRTIGEGASAQITLDPTAANHGWYFDYTPYLNEEYLPTSNPNEWIAKPGCRMDLLSVLLHEYGHVLGLDHSANGHDFMAATLAPGVRRLPTAEELAQLNALSAATTAPETPTPGLPLGASLGALWVGRLRRKQTRVRSRIVTSYNTGPDPELPSQLSDGRVDSNVATVTLTVTPVNDAPTAEDRSLTTAEDTALTGSGKGHEAGHGAAPA